MSEITDIILSLATSNIDINEKKNILCLLINAQQKIEKPKKVEEPKRIEPKKEKEPPKKRGRKPISFNVEKHKPQPLEKEYTPIEIPPLRDDMTVEEKRQRRLLMMRANKQKHYYLDADHRQECIKNNLLRYHAKKLAE